MKVIQRLLQRVLAVTTARPLLTLLIAFFLAAGSALYTAKKLEFQTSQKDLISPENRLIRLSKKIEQFEDLDTFVVAIENRNRGQSVRFLHTLVSRLEKDKEHYLEVFYQVDKKAFEPWTLLYLDEDELTDLCKNITEHREFIHRLASKPGLVNFFDQLNKEMASRMIGELFTGFLQEESSAKKSKPFDLSFLIESLKEMKQWLDAYRQEETPIATDSPWEYFFSSRGSRDKYKNLFWTDNEHYLLVFVTPKKSSEGFINTYHSLLALRREIERVKKNFPGINVGVTGQEALNQDEMNIAFHDMSTATIISLSGLMLLLVLFWRGFRRPLLEITELLLALAWTFGLTTLFIGHLNILSITFAPLLLGLGIDYGIHWFARYQEIERTGRLNKREAISETMVNLGPGILLAGGTAALSFFPLVLTGFKGLAELGVIVTMGMIMTTVTTLCVLPSLTLLFDKFNRGRRQTATESSASFLHLNNGMALAIIVPSCVLVAMSIWKASKVSFDLNVLNLQSSKAESVVWERKLLSDSKRSSMYGAVLAHSLMEVEKKTTALKALPTVSEVHSIEDVLPKNQLEKLKILRRITPLLPSVEALTPPKEPVDIGRLAEVLSRIRFKMLDSAASQWGAERPLRSQMLEVRGLISKLRDRFTELDKPTLQKALKSYEKAFMKDLRDKLDLLRKNANARPMRISDLPKSIRERFITRDGLYLIRVYPAEDIWQPEHLSRFVHDLRSVDPDVIGDPVTLYVFTKAFRDGCLKAVVYAVAFVIVLLLTTFKSVVETSLVMIPLTVGTIWTLGLMGILGVNFNLANTIFIPLVVGAGVEYGIIIMQRFREKGTSLGEFIIPYSVAKGIILAGLTTTVGFGSLAISHHQGIHSLGMLAMVGSLSILAASVVFLPALIQILLSYSASFRWRYMEDGSPIK